MNNQTWLPFFHNLSIPLLQQYYNNKGLISQHFVHAHISNVIFDLGKIDATYKLCKCLVTWRPQCLRFIGSNWNIKQWHWTWDIEFSLLYTLKLSQEIRGAEYYWVWHGNLRQKNARTKEDLAFRITTPWTHTLDFSTSLSQWVRKWSESTGSCTCRGLWLWEQQSVRTVCTALWVFGTLSPAPICATQQII